MSYRVRVWDLPTRVFHWSIAFVVVVLFATAYAGATDWHARAGYAVLTLLLFRIVWGFIGGRWSRFSSFLRAPRSVVAYLGGRVQPEQLVGHNPLGAVSVVAMLLLLLAQVATGLLADDEIAFTGPLNRFVSSARGLAATWYHRQVGQWLLVALVLLHLVAIVYYVRRKRQVLLRPMLVGDKELSWPAPAARDDALTRLAALAVLAACAGLVWWLVGLGTPPAA